MARRKISPEERFTRRLWAEVRRSQSLAGETDKETRAVLGLCESTFQTTRTKRPDTWKAVELFRLARHFGWGPEEINRIFKEEST